MSGAEHEILGGVIFSLLGAFFLVVLPYCHFTRKNELEELNEEGEFEKSIRRTWEKGDQEQSPYDPPAAYDLSIQLEEAEKNARLPGPIDLLGVGLFVILFLLAWKGAGIDTGEIELTAEAVMVSSLSMLFLAGLVPLMIFWRGKVGVFLKWHRFEAGEVFAISAMFLGAMLVFLFLLNVSGYPSWVESQIGEMRTQEVVNAMMQGSDIWLDLSLAISAVIVAPVAEEVIFRGYIYQATRRYTGVGPAAVFSGVLFGVIHFNLLSLPALAVFGVALAIIYEKTKSLWVPVMCHAVFNGFQVVLALGVKYSGVEIPEI